MTKLKWGMIGGGEGSQIGPAHRLGARLMACSNSPRAPLITGRRGASTMASVWAFADRAYGAWQEMLEGEKHREDRIDLVTVATPNATHFEITKAFLEAGFQRALRKADDDDGGGGRRNCARRQRRQAKFVR